MGRGSMMAAMEQACGALLMLMLMLMMMMKPSSACGEAVHQHHHHRHACSQSDLILSDPLLSFSDLLLISCLSFFFKLCSHKTTPFLFLQ
jgi:hypothetical protein